MAPSFDCVSTLLCAEDNTIFDDDDYNGGSSPLEMLKDTWHHPSYHNRNNGQRLDFVDDDPFWLPLPVISDECLAVMVENECHHLPAEDYVNKLRNGDLDFGARNEAIDWIQKVREHFGFGPLCAYLAINYLDRFLSAYELPKQRVWTMKLLAVACLSIAAKIEENEVPLCVDLQVGESKFVFEAKTIQRMELLVLSTLRWRMQAITPFSFIDYFLCKSHGDQRPTVASIMRSTQLILSTVKEIDFMDFRPSEVAAAVAIAVMGETKTVHIEKAIPVLIQEKDSVLKCVKMIQQELSSNSGSDKDAISASVSVPCMPQSPIGVLDTACLSYKSDDSINNAASCANPSHNNNINNSPDTKRRKLNNSCAVSA